MKSKRGFKEYGCYGHHTFPLLLFFIWLRLFPTEKNTSTASYNETNGIVNKNTVDSTVHLNRSFIYIHLVIENEKSSWQTFLCLVISDTWSWNTSTTRRTGLFVQLKYIHSVNPYIGEECCGCTRIKQTCPPGGTQTYDQKNSDTDSSAAAARGYMNVTQH